MKDQFCPQTEAKCVREDCVCFELVDLKEGNVFVEKPYCNYFKVYLRVKK